jgi:phosphatidylglycerophosphate synthase
VPQPRTLWHLLACAIILFRYRPSYNRGLPLRARFGLLAIVGLAVVIGVAVILRPWLQAGALYPWKAAALFAAMTAIAFGFIGEHPFQTLGPANRVTMIRLMLLALVGSLIGEPEIPQVAAASATSATVMAVLDGVDGWLARRTRMASKFGARFDMETDALLIMVLSILVWRLGKAGAWVLLGGLLRYAFVSAGWLLPWMARPLSPTTRARSVAVAHVVGLIVAVSPIIPVPLSALAAATTLTALCWSFAVDVRRLWRKE